MSAPTVFVVDDDAAVRDSLTLLLDTSGYHVECFENGEAFLSAGVPGRPGCVLLDLRMGEASGIDVQAELSRSGSLLPVIFLTAHGDIPTTVRAIQGGAVDFLTKPVDPERLIDRIEAALEKNRAAITRGQSTRADRELLGLMTSREVEVLRLAVAGHANKEIARLLGISHRTVEFHRSQILAKSGVKNLLQLANLVTAKSP